MPTQPSYEAHDLLKNVGALDVSPAFQPYSGVEVVVDENTSFTAGDATGRVLTIENPWGTQEQADNILEAIKGFTYQPYDATSALLDPSAEIGDGVGINDMYSGIFRLSRDFGSAMQADISAPQSEDVDHEYPYESKKDREITRRFSAVESEFAIQSSEISAKVSKTSPTGQSAFSWSLQENQWEIKSNGTTVFKVTSSGAEVSGKITATSGKIGGFDIGSNAISYNGLTWNGNKTGVYLGTSGIQLGAANGAFFQASSGGTVKAHNMTLTGTLTIGGQTISAAALRSGAQSAYNNGGTWTSTSNGWGGATSGNNAVNTFYAANLYAVKTFTFGVKKVSLQWVRTTDGGQIQALCV